METKLSPAAEAIVRAQNPSLLDAGKKRPPQDEDDLDPARRRSAAPDPDVDLQGLSEGAKSIVLAQRGRPSPAKPIRSPGSPARPAAATPSPSSTSPPTSAKYRQMTDADRKAFWAGFSERLSGGGSR